VAARFFAAGAFAADALPFHACGLAAGAGRDTSGLISSLLPSFDARLSSTAATGVFGLFLVAFVLPFSFAALSFAAAASSTRILEAFLGGISGRREPPVAGPDVRGWLAAKGLTLEPLPVLCLVVCFVRAW
jgi:hypothetical protein